MGNIRGPFTGLQFYYADRTEAKAMIDLGQALVKRRARVVNVTVLSHGGRTTFACPTDTDREHVGSTPSLEDIGNRYPIEMAVQQATGTTGATELLRVLRISEAAATVDRHPISLWTEGDAFEMLDERRIPRTAKQTGIKLYKVFKELIAATAPSYAAITHEYDVECPTDLAADNRSYAFVDFYVSEGYLGSQQLRSVNNAAGDVYREDLGSGIYFSGFAPFNPQHKSADTPSKVSLSNAAIEAIVNSHRVSVA